MVLSLKNVTKTYGVVAAVDGVSFDADDGELVALLGESGCGKTTTLKMINRLIEPTSGRIDLNGEDISAADPVALRRTIGYAFQGVGLFPHMTVSENVAITPRLLGWEPGRTDARIQELLELVNLTPQEFQDRFPSELSGGQQQRVGFARALAAGPSIMLLDEPFGALDPMTRDQLQDDFLKIQKSLSLTTVLVTHDMTEALLLADKIIVMRQGAIVQEGTPTDLLASPADAYVTALVSTPKRQADRLEALARRENEAPHE